MTIQYSHHHLHVGVVGAHRKFWVEGLGATPGPSVGGAEAFTLSGALVLLDEMPNTGGTKGTTVNHLGFQVPDLRRTVDRLKEAGFPLVTREEITAVPPEAVKDDIAFNPTIDANVAMAMGPEGTKVELIEAPALAVPIAMHHVHFFSETAEAMRDWYVAMFGAAPASRGKFKTAELPGVSLTVSPSSQPVVGTSGRVIDHIGFNVTGLADLLETLQAAGVRFEMPDPRLKEMGIASAFFTDPWGTSLELTERLGDR